MHAKPVGLGTKLRQLIEMLDGAVDAFYVEHGLDYRARYTPVMRALSGGATLPIKDIAIVGRMSHPAASQTIAMMIKFGLLAAERGDDGRERLIALSDKGNEILRVLEPIWAATNRAAAGLDAEIGTSLGGGVDYAIEALSRRGFADRIRTEMEE